MDSDKVFGHLIDKDSELYKYSDINKVHEILTLKEQNMKLLTKTKTTYSKTRIKVIIDDTKKQMSFLKKNG